MECPEEFLICKKCGMATLWLSPYKLCDGCEKKRQGREASKKGWKRKLKGGE